MIYICKLFTSQYSRSFLKYLEIWGRFYTRYLETITIFKCIYICLFKIELLINYCLIQGVLLPFLFPMASYMTLSLNFCVIHYYYYCSCFMRNQCENRTKKRSLSSRIYNKKWIIEMVKLQHIFDAIDNYSVVKGTHTTF